jgi:hypothetical protein
MKPKVQLPSQIKKQDQPKPLSDADIITLARHWARLHAKPSLRGAMDDLLKELPEPVQRKVILCGQRIAAGLPPKIAP